MLHDDMTLSGHEVVIGRTQSGKTYYAVKARAASWRASVLFFNPQGFLVSGEKWVSCGGHNLVTSIVAVLKTGLRVSYIPSDKDDIAEKELSCLVDAIFATDFPPPGLLFIADEAQDFPAPLRRIARRGLARGVTGVFISQRPAEMHNTLLTQATRHVIFDSSWENQYFKRYGLDAEKIEQTLRKAPPHSYIVVEGGCISPAHKV